MKYKFLTKLFIIVLFLFPMLVKADCSDEIKELYKKNEDKFKITYKMNLDNLKYNVYFYNPLPGKFDYAVGFSKDIKWEEIENNTTVDYDVPSGTYQIYIVSIAPECNKVIFKKTSITLPEQSELSKDEHCKGIEEFVLCQPDYDKEITYEDFVSRTETYRKTKIKEEEKNRENEEKERNQIISNIVNYINDNIVTIVIIVIFIAVVIASLIVGIKSFRKSRRLE